jgi:hypothetical protein
MLCVDGGVFAASSLCAMLGCVSASAEALLILLRLGEDELGPIADPMESLQPSDFLVRVLVGLVGPHTSRALIAALPKYPIAIADIIHSAEGRCVGACN